MFLLICKPHISPNPNAAKYSDDYMKTPCSAVDILAGGVIHDLTNTRPDQYQVAKENSV
jgi:hypothetical protein